MSLRFWTMKYEGSFVQHPVKQEWMRVDTLKYKSGYENDPQMPEDSIGHVRVKLMNQAGNYFTIDLTDIKVVPPTESYRILNNQAVWCSRNMEKQYKLGVSQSLWNTTPHVDIGHWLNTPIPVHSKPEEVFYVDDKPLVFADQLSVQVYPNGSNVRNILYQGLPIYQVTRSDVGIKINKVQRARIPSFIQHWDKYLGITYEYKGLLSNGRDQGEGEGTWGGLRTNYMWTYKENCELFSGWDMVLCNNGEIIFRIDGDDYDLNSEEDAHDMAEDHSADLVSDLVDIYYHGIDVMEARSSPEAPVNPRAVAELPTLVDGMPAMVEGVPKDPEVEGPRELLGVVDSLTPQVWVDGGLVHDPRRGMVRNGVIHDNPVPYPRIEVRDNGVYVADQVDPVDYRAVVGWDMAAEPPAPAPPIGLGALARGHGFHVPEPLNEVQAVQPEAARQVEVARSRLHGDWLEDLRARVPHLQGGDNND